MVDTTTYGLHSLQYTAASIGNDIPYSIKMIDNLVQKYITETYKKSIISE